MDLTGFIASRTFFPSAGKWLFQKTIYDSKLKHDPLYNVTCTNFTHRNLVRVIIMTECWLKCVRKYPNDIFCNQILSVDWHIRICKKEAAITCFTHEKCGTVTSYRIRKIGFPDKYTSKPLYNAYFYQKGDDFDFIF